MIISIIINFIAPNLSSLIFIIHSLNLLFLKQNETISIRDENFQSGCCVANGMVNFHSMTIVKGIRKTCEKLDGDIQL